MYRVYLFIIYNLTGRSKLWRGVTREEQNRNRERLELEGTIETRLVISSHRRRLVVTRR